MINRVLIRIKVVQMLYGYLLTRNSHAFADPAAGEEDVRRDRAYGHAVACAFVSLILHMSGYNRRGEPLPGASDVKALQDSPLIRALATNDVLLQQIDNEDVAPIIEALLPLADSLLTRIKQGAEYKAWTRRKERNAATDADFWAAEVRTLFADSTVVHDALRSARGLDFSLVGMRRGVEECVAMLRRHGDTSMALGEAQKQLRASLDKAYELYCGLLTLPVEITRRADLNLDNARHKYLPTDEEINAPTRFVDNLLPQALSANTGLKEWATDHPFKAWSDDIGLVERLLESVQASEDYRQYLQQDDRHTMAEDGLLWRHLMQKVILPSDALAEALEERSVYWNDDLHIMGQFVLKTLKQVSSAPTPEAAAGVPLLPQYKDEEDARFGALLFETAVQRYEELRGYIDRFLNEGRWEADRLAFMDVVITVTALAEILTFPSIPVLVSLNEYIEIANAYSTPRSGKFINGLLYTILCHMKETGMLQKPFNA